MSLTYEVVRRKSGGLGGIIYSRHGIKHRTDGPSLMYSDGETFWFQHGDFHRTDGPGRIWHQMDVSEYYIRGYQYSKEEYESKIRSG